MRLTLRAKGILAFAALMTYLVVVASILSAERQRLLEVAIDLEQGYMEEGELAKTGNSIDHSMIRLDEILRAYDPAVSKAEDVALSVELIQSGFQALQKRHPFLDTDIRDLGDQVNKIRAAPSRAALMELKRAHAGLESRLGDLGIFVREQRKLKWETYYRINDRMTYIAISTMVFAALVFGALVFLFFSRMAWDIGKLEARAVDIVAGYRGPPLAVTREDEIGALMGAVNRMQSEIRKHEQHLELVRQQRFHQEKMAAVGSIAAAVAHEINNPIAAIAGIAQSMATAGAAGAGGNGDFEGDGLKLILEQTQRISAISRQIAEFTRPHSQQPELTDLNRLVQSVCRFTGYDRRLRAIGMKLDLDPGMPAVECVADHLTQVLMNLLINSADALAGMTGREPGIRVATCRIGDEVTLAVQDNGHGMDEATRQRAFEEGFSTKAAGQGLGLFLCKALVEGDGGRIEIDSAFGAGTTVTVRVPLRSATAA